MSFVPSSAVIVISDFSAFNLEFRGARRGHAKKSAIVCLTQCILLVLSDMNKVYLYLPLAAIPTPRKKLSKTYSLKH